MPGGIREFSAVSEPLDQTSSAVVVSSLARRVDSYQFELKLAGNFATGLTTALSPPQLFSDT